MYKFKGIIVILSKLYPTPINRGIVPCIRHTVLARESYFALPTKVYFLYLRVITPRSQTYTCNSLFNRKRKKQVMFDKVESCVSCL
jgi:hypothetical protein